MIADQHEFRTPPPIPPRPKRIDSFEKSHPLLAQCAEQQPHPVTSYASAEDKLSTKGKAHLSEGMSLKKLVSKHSKSFPLRIHVLEGFSGHTSELTISTADEYNIHFTKHQTVVTVRASSGEIYSIPINSAVQFGLIYNPEKQPCIFENVADIIALKTLPKVVCATVAYMGNDETASVAENEVLCIKRVHNPMFHGRKSLEVHSLLTGGKKQLPLECLGKFSTDPSLIQMRLLDMLDHVSSLFPSQAMMFTGEEFSRSVQELPSSLLSNRITLTESKTETSLVASTVDTGIPLEQAENLIDIPLDDCLANVKVAIVQLDDVKETERLQIQTRNLLKNIDLAKLQSYRDAASDNVYTTQSLFYTTLEKGRERIGVKLDAPSPMLSRGLPREEKDPPSPMLRRGLTQEERDAPSPKLSRGLPEEKDPPSPMLSRGLPKEKDPPSPMLSRGLPKEKDAPSPMLRRGLPQEERDAPLPTLSRGLPKGKHPPSPMLRRGLPREKRDIPLEESASARKDIEFDGNSDYYAEVSFQEPLPSVPNYMDIQPVDIEQATYDEPRPNESEDSQEYYATLNSDAKPPLTKKVETLQQQMQKLEYHFSSWKQSQARALKSIEERLEKLSKCLESLETQFTQLSSSNRVLQATGTSQMPTYKAGCSSGEKNIMFLQSLTVAQVRQFSVIR